MKALNPSECRGQYLVSMRAPARPLAVIAARTAAEACRRVAHHLGDELAAPCSVRRLRVERYRSSALPRHLPVYADEYFTDPAWKGYLH